MESNRPPRGGADPVALTALALRPGLSGGVLGGHWWRYCGFMQIYPVGGNGAGLAVAWTLCVEITFYFFLVLYAVAMARLAAPSRHRHWMRREAVALLALGAASFGVHCGVHFAGWPHWFDRSLLGQLDYFAVGMALALVSVVVAAERRPVWWVAIIERFPGLFVAAAVALYAAMAHFWPIPFRNVPALHLVAKPVSFKHQELDYLLRAVVALLVMLPVVFDARQGLTRRALEARPLVALGVISYGVYLYHATLLGVISPQVGRRPSTWVFGSAMPLMFVLTLLVTLPLAVLSYRCVELPFLRRRYPASVREPVVARVVAGQPAGIIVLGEGASLATVPSPGKVRMEERVVPGNA